MYIQNILSFLTAIFPGEPGLAGTSIFWILLELRMDSGENWGYKWKSPFRSSSSANQHPAFYRLGALPVTQPTEHC